jgi:hypothetical protein
MSQAVARVLSDAADIIERDGWVQRHYFGSTRHLHPAFYDGSGACALGALLVAAWREEAPGYDSGLRRLQEEAVRALEAHLIEVAPVEVLTRARDRLVGTWNDDRRRTKDEVVAALRATAEKEGCW